MGPELNLNVSSGSFSFLSPPSSQPWTVDRTYPSRHDGIVRSLLVDDVSGCLVTGGEDGALHLWELIPSNTPSSPSKPGRKRELDGEREADEMDVDRLQVCAVKLQPHHTLITSSVVQKAETEVTLATFRSQYFTPALTGSSR